MVYILVVHIMVLNFRKVGKLWQEDEECQDVVLEDCLVGLLPELGERI